MRAAAVTRSAGSRTSRAFASVCSSKPEIDHVGVLTWPVGEYAQAVTTRSKAAVGSMSSCSTAILGPSATARRMVSQGLAIEAARASMLHALDNLRNVTEEVFAAIESGDHADDQATLDTYAEGLRTVQDQLRRVGQRAPILDAAMGQVEEARAAGLAELGISAQASSCVAEPGPRGGGPPAGLSRSRGGCPVPTPDAWSCHDSRSSSQTGA